MKSTILIKLLIGVLLVTQFGWMACNDNKQTNSENGNASINHAMAILNGTMPDTAVSGTVEFNEDGGKVKMKLDITVPSKANQSVAVHIHQNGDCGDMGKAAGGHWNPTNQNHGKWGSSSFHSGDIGNISLDANGKGSMELETDLWSIGGDAKTNMLDKSIIVHGGMDDYTSQPAGNAGERIGCGLIKKT